MTDLAATENRQRKKSGFGRSKRHSVRIDMTPMVDLGFLLITFFIFTSSMSEPAAMPLIMPNDKGAPMPTKQSGALTIILSQTQRVYYYEGEFTLEKIQSTTTKEIRNIIVAKKLRTAEDDLFLIIKPARTVDYKTVVDILDEMVISRVERYALAKISPEEAMVADQY